MRRGPPGSRRSSRAGRPRRTLTVQPRWSPLADVSETEDAYLIEADLPGVSQDQVSVEVSGGDLLISGEIARPEHAGVLRRATRRLGRFEYARCCLPMPTQTRCRRRWPAGH
jgi:HSP20 family protein